MLDDDMETYVAAEEIQRHWRGTQVRKERTQKLHQEHQEDYNVHLQSAAAHTEQGLELLAHTTSQQTRMDKEILEKSKKRQRAQDRRKISSAMLPQGSPSGYYFWDKESVETAPALLALLLQRFQRCLRLLCQQTQQRPFEIFDQDRNGSVTRGEFRKTVVDYDLAISEQEMDLLLRHMDSNEDGVIDLHEWSAIFNSNVDPTTQHVLSKEGRRALDDRINTDPDALASTKCIQRVYRGSVGRVRSTNRMHEKFRLEEEEMDKRRSAMLISWEREEEKEPVLSISIGKKVVVEKEEEEEEEVEVEVEEEEQMPVETSPFFSAFVQGMGGGTVVGVVVSPVSNGVSVSVSPSKHPQQVHIDEPPSSHSRSPKISQPTRPKPRMAGSRSGEKVASRASRVNEAAKYVVNDAVKQGLSRMATPAKNKV
jgi:hypothetical protein